jgi:diaminopimelate epimerase
MKYYNSDGRTSTFCGNGGRCIVAFAAALQVHVGKCRFLGTDGWHEGTVLEDGMVRISMTDVHQILLTGEDGLILNTGSPHYITFRDQIEDIDVFAEGRAIRNSPSFQKEGINVNFVEQRDEDHILVRTYERGVEDETFSCGTGVTASALVNYHNENGFNEVEVKTLGGRLNVEFDRIDDGKFRNIWLCGPAERVFNGSIEI